MARTDKVPIGSFKGLNNMVDPLRLSPDYQTQADNVDITDRGAIQRARGFVRSTTNFAIAGAYATIDRQRLYVVDAGELRQMNADLTTYSVLKSGLAASKMRFAEVNGNVYYTNGTDFGVIEPAAVRGWGIVPPAAPDLLAARGSLPAGIYRVACTLVDERGLESGNGAVAMVEVAAGSSIAVTNIEQRAGFSTNVYVTACDGAVFFRLQTRAGVACTYNVPPEQLGREIPYWFRDAPRGTHPAFFGGRMYVGEAFPQHDLSLIWRSLPLDFHHFDYAEEAIVLPGNVRIVDACEEALIVATERAVHAFDGARLRELASYGVVDGFHASRLDGDLYLWTLRGLAKMLPYQLLTDRLLSVAPGVAAGATVMERDGQRRYIVALQRGGTAYNPRT